MGSLSCLYCANRGKENEHVLSKFVENQKQINSLLYDDENVCVVRMVVKYPANSSRSFERVKVNESGILEVVVDQSNAIQSLPLLREGFDFLERMKKKNK